MNKYKELDQEQKDELLSNYLIDSWSYSKVSAFARNEKAFEMQYIYHCYSKSSASTIAGQAYHNALNLFFLNLKDGIMTDIVDLEAAAFLHIDNVPAAYWKIQKTTPTVEECKISATKTVTLLLNNFLSQIKIYTDEIKEVISCEMGITSWITVNGVDIPMPCHLVIDLIILTNDGKRVIIDHKSKKSFTDEKELQFTIGKQAISYVLGYEEHTGETIDEVWFIENKYSQNRDKSPQLVRFKAKMDADGRRLYEAMLYEALRRMIEAVGDPDYVYMINDNDSFTDRAEIYDFWARTMIAEVEDFNIPENKRELLRQRMRKVRDASLANVTPTVIRNFKTFTEEFIPYDFTNKNMTNQEKIEHILRSFGIVAKVQHIFDGYSSASYLLEINAGVQISSIQRYRLDIANALNVSNVRINKDLFVYEGKAYLAIESGKKNTSTLTWDSSKLEGHRLPVGIDNFGQVVYWDLDNNSTPHCLVCGATGCLAANTQISCYVTHYSRHSKTKTIETLFNLQNGKHDNRLRIGNDVKKEILVRCLDENTNKFTYSPFEVVYSGKKQCFKMITDAGQAIECTADHKFLSSFGWKKLSELNVGDKIMRGHQTREFTGKQKQLPLKDVFIKYHPKGRKRTIIDKTSGKPYEYFRITYSHFVYEADKNGMTLDAYKNLLNNYDGRDLYFIPKGFQVDHIDGNRKNNDISNLQLLTRKEHSIKTLNTATGVFGYFRPQECSIVSIVPTNIIDTYDICCKGENHNFVANGLVVHNSGKSVSLKSTVEYALLSGINDIYIFDPKHEFKSYSGRATVVNDIEDIETQMALLVLEMEERVKKHSEKKTIVIFDEFADAVANSRKGNDLKVYGMEQDGKYASGQPKFKRVLKSTDKSLEENLRILLQKGRSSGFRIIAATQRASTKVITGDAKVNFPVQICFRVPKDIDSIVVLDEPGAESLNGRGDGLIKSPEYMNVIRFQGFYKE